MTDPTNEPDAPVAPEEIRCAECHTRLDGREDRVETEGGVFCAACFENLRTQVTRAMRAQSEDVNYPVALAGGMLGGAVGVLVWWGFTILTNVGFGLVAVVIGIAVGKGVVLFSGSKRSVGLQGLSAGVSAIAFFYASYLVNRTFLQRAYPDAGLPWVPDLDLLIKVVQASFGVMDLVFLAIVLWQAWKIPAPFRWADGPT